MKKCDRKKGKLEKNMQRKKKDKKRKGWKKECFTPEEIILTRKCLVLFAPHTR